MAAPRDDVEPQRDLRQATVQLDVRESREDPLVARLAEEMVRRWQAGDRPGAEEFLDRHPELWQRPERAARLIYEEICLRQERGERQASVAVAARFPEWRGTLARMVSRVDEPAQPPHVPDDFRILATLGSGRWGEVFLATQPALADRPVVLKITPRGGAEHVSLARLQHTHIVPIFSVQDDRASGQRILCMPYLGGATLERVLEATHDVPPAERTGRDMLRGLDAARLAGPVVVPEDGPARAFLAAASYEQAVCWVGACLADALAYAHDRGLVHLDVKPSNVLLAADAQPMLLDFHLAQAPLRPEGTAPATLGGTPAYMSPEQELALDAVRERRPVERVVDGRSDVYSLGLVLYECLGGKVPLPNGRAAPVRQFNPAVSVGLQDIVARCLSPLADDRYASATELAGDLRRHLTDQPLEGVANRSRRELWRKWRRRRPYALVALVAGLVAALAVGALGAARIFDHWREGEQALSTGQALFQKKDFAGAERSFAQGLEVVESVPLAGRLEAALTQRLALARQSRLAAELHRVADLMRLHALDAPSPGLRADAANARRIWETRAEIFQPMGGSDEGGQVRRDLLDVAIIWANWRTRLAGPAEAADEHRQALGVLAEAERFGGASAVLASERAAHAAAMGQPREARAAEAEAQRLSAQSAWEHYALGRFWLMKNDLAAAERELGEALRLEPGDVWPNFYTALCAFRRRDYTSALVGFSVCCALAPNVAEFFHNRALVHTELGHTDAALEDYSEALRRDPSLAAAALNRGLLLVRTKQPKLAIVDLQHAADLGAEPAATQYALALAYLDLGDRTQALAIARRLLERDPGHGEARELVRRLEQARGGR